MNLRWNTTEYGGVKDLRIPPHRIWKPDVLMYNRWGLVRMISVRKLLPLQCERVKFTSSIMLAVPMKDLTAHFPPTSSYETMARACMCHRESLNRHAKLISLGFRSTISVARWNSAAGRTTAFRWAPKADPIGTRWPKNYFPSLAWPSASRWDRRWHK